MLETEDIDDDYFTPASSTSLANIFGKTHKEDGTDNESLKYTPPKPTKPEEPKATQCVFACAVVGNEWLGGTYEDRGKLGFAILKIIKTGSYNLVLYDSNKKTLSCATISKYFVATFKEHLLCFLYNDDQSKYWCLYASEHEIKKIIDVLKNLNVVVKCESQEVKLEPETSNANIINEIKEQTVKEDKESDTDSSINRRTKISILNRMASMGQSVLPPRTVSTERTSDSSDTNETSHHKTVRHKPVKSALKRNSSDKNLIECQSLVETSPPNIEHASNSVPFFTYVNGQLVPVTNSNIVSCNSSSNDMSHFMSEQRISNTEIRINMTRMNDKVDQILGKVSCIEDKNNTANNFQMEILQKLLAEYESKIKMYEEIINFKESNVSSRNQITDLFPKERASISVETESKQIKHLEQLNKEKENKIVQLEAECQLLRDKYTTCVNEGKKNKEDYIEEVDRLKQELNKKTEELTETYQKTKEVSISRDLHDNIADKLKNVMNDTYRSISANFDNNEVYSGEKVKVLTASIIKKITIEALNNL